MQTEKIEILLSKRKMTLALLGSLLFIVLGFWFLIRPPKIDSPIFGNPIFIFIAGLSSVIFFGFISIVIFRKLSDKQAGLTISKDGIIDNSSGVSAGLILWSEIKEIKVSKISSQKFLMLFLYNPQDYLNGVTNPLKRKTMSINYKIYGSPVCISANSLKTNTDNLFKLLNEKLTEYKL